MTNLIQAFLQKFKKKKTMIDKTRELAKKTGWNEIAFKPVERMISFSRETERINVYYTTMTVGTVVTHPLKGRTQLFRRNVSEKELEKIFHNPRVHTRKGYYTL